MATLIPTDAPTPQETGIPPAPCAREAVPAPATSSARRTGAADPATGEGGVRPRHRATGPVTSRERQHLARLARAAWEKCGAKGAGIPCDEWRHEQVALATGGRAAGLRDLRRGQYRDALAHFLSVAGEGARAFRVARRSGQGEADRDLALYKLREACEAGGLAFPEYPEAICRHQFRVGLDRLETGKIWFLFYTCTRRAREKAEKASPVDSEGPSGKSAVSTLGTPSDAPDPTGGVGERQL